MKNSPFVKAANDLLALYKPCVGYTFISNKPFGPVKGDFDEPLLNLGTVGAFYLAAIAETFTDTDVAAIFDHSADRDEFMRWIASAAHSFNRTQPKTFEQQGLKMSDEQANADIYRLLGFPT